MILNRSSLLAGLLAFAVTDAAKAELKVWTVAETRHVLRSELPGTNTSVSLHSARSEWVGFQILLRSDTPVKGINIEPEDLKGPGGAVLARADTRLYRQHQLHLEVGTYRNDSFKPDWYPDPLIPFVHPLTGKKLEGARIVAVPFDLLAKETHGFWVDLHVPRNAVPGQYHGVYRVFAGGNSTREIPVSLAVLNFTLPQTPALVTAFETPRLRD